MRRLFDYVWEDILGRIKARFLLGNVPDRPENFIIPRTIQPIIDLTTEAGRELQLVSFPAKAYTGVGWKDVGTYVDSAYARIMAIFGSRSGDRGIIGAAIKVGGSFVPIASQGSGSIILVANTYFNDLKIKSGWTLQFNMSGGTVDGDLTADMLVETSPGVP